MADEIDPSVLRTWCKLKIAECDQEVAMAKIAGMERAAAPFARDARFFRAIVCHLPSGDSTSG